MLGTAWEQLALSRATEGWDLLAPGRLHLRERYGAQVATSRMHSWGSSGRGLDDCQPAVVQWIGLVGRSQTQLPNRATTDQDGAFGAAGPVSASRALPWRARPGRTPGRVSRQANHGGSPAHSLRRDKSCSGQWHCIRTAIPTVLAPIKSSGRSSRRKNPSNAPPTHSRTLRGFLRSADPRRPCEPSWRYG